MIKLANINKSYINNANEDNIILSKVNLNILKGDTFGIVGKSGAGKSSILNIIGALDTSYSGTLKINDIDLSTLKNAELVNYRKKLGFIFQDANLLSNLTLVDNIALPLKLNHIPKKIRRDKAIQLLAYVGLEGLENRYPHQISGGEKQRVAIARALINEPSLLLCDEITSSLDHENSIAIINLINEIKQKFNLTIVYVSHDLEFVKYICNKVAIVKDGTVNDVIKLPKNDASKLLKEFDYQNYFGGETL